MLFVSFVVKLIFGCDCAVFIALSAARAYTIWVGRAERAAQLGNRRREGKFAGYLPFHSGFLLERKASMPSRASSEMHMSEKTSLLCSKRSAKPMSIIL